MDAFKVPFWCFFLATILLTFQSHSCFRLKANQSEVIFDEEDQLNNTTSFPDTSEEHNVDITVGNRTKMIVANEIYNLPRFDPKNGHNKQSNWVVSTEIPPLPELADPEEVTSLRNASSSRTDLYDACQFCPDARFMQHYFAKGCIAMELQNECHPRFCPKYFDCPKEKELPKDGCLYEDKSYKFGENVLHRDPCQHCVCINSTNGAMLSCAISECFNAWTAIEPNCYRKYSEGQCCPEIVCVPPNQTLATCAYEENLYNFGDYFSPEGDPCHNCLCDERWNQTKTPLESVCTRQECHFDFERPENKGCVPVYSDKSCCPMYFHCPDEPSKANQPKCKFGDNHYEIGEQIKVKQHEICLECSCLVPPEITCKHKSCPMTPKNCTSVFVEGNCCPQFKCDSEIEAHEEEDSVKDSSLEKMTSSNVDDEMQCLPMDSCKDPCKLVFEEMDAGSAEHSERVRCPRCQCEPVRIALEPVNGTSLQTDCGNTKAPCPRANDPTSDETDLERWGKSVKLDKLQATLKPSSRRCPDVACQYPCYIYKVTSGDCPRCSCPSNAVKSETGKSS